VQVITRDSDGNLRILSRPLDQVCPVGVSDCGAQPTFAVTAVSGVMSATTLQGAVSPAGDRMVVVAGGANGDGVYIVPVGNGTKPAPSHSAPASPTPRVTPAATASAPHPAGTAAETPSTSAARSPSAATVSPAITLTPSEAPTPSGPGTPPSLAVESPTGATPDAMTPAPAAAIQIASNVKVVGVPVYAPDGLHLAFAAMPSDGSSGPDVYVWTAGDLLAHAVTADHDSWLAAWTADGILLSRAVDGFPSTVLLDPATGLTTDVGEPGSWLPELSPDGRTAAWWEGTVRLAADGLSWVPDAGALVVGAWPASSLEPTKTLVAGPLAAWRVRWAEDGGALAVWTAAQGTGSDGQLSLYRVEPTPFGPGFASGAPDAGSGSPDVSQLSIAPVTAPPATTPIPASDLASGSADASLPSASPITGSPDLANPMLDRAPADPDFSLRAGRLVWTAPSPTRPQTVEVLAWVGTAIGRLEIQADGAGTVLP
jgi:hypothetical protein